MQLRKIWVSLPNILGCIHPNNKIHAFLHVFLCPCFKTFCVTFWVFLRLLSTHAQYMYIFNRPRVARAVLQTPPRRLLIGLLIT